MTNSQLTIRMAELPDIIRWENPDGSIQLRIDGQGNLSGPLASKMKAAFFAFAMVAGAIGGSTSFVVYNLLDK